MKLTVIAAFIENSNLQVITMQVGFQRERELASYRKVDVYIKSHSTLSLSIYIYIPLQLSMLLHQSWLHATKVSRWKNN